MCIPGAEVLGCLDAGFCSLSIPIRGGERSVPAHRSRGQSSIGLFRLLRKI